MKRRSFYISLVRIAKEGRDAMNEFNGEIRECQKKIESGRYSEKFIRELQAKIIDLKAQRRMAPEKYLKETQGLIDKTVSDLENEVALRGSDIVKDDLALLDFNLTANELSDMLTRYEGNPTMSKLILRHASEKGFDLGRIYIGNDATIRDVKSVYQAMEVVFKYPDSDSVFERLMGEDSPVSELFDVDDDPVRNIPVLSYSDDRVANAVQMLSSGTRLGDVVQKDIIREFADQPGILPVLKSAAKRGFNSLAAECVDNLLLGRDDPFGDEETPADDGDAE